MTDRIEITSTRVVEGPLFYEQGEEGPQTRCYFFVSATAADGRVFEHYVGYDARRDAEQFAAQVQEHGSIADDPDTWAVDDRPGYGTPEWEDDAAAFEAEQRANNDEPIVVVRQS